MLFSSPNSCRASPSCLPLPSFPPTQIPVVPMTPFPSFNACKNRASRPAATPYVQMQDDNLIPDRPTYVTTLKACTMLAQESKASCEPGGPVRLIALDIGRMLQSIIYMNDFAHNIYVDCSLITLYGKCGALLEAGYIFISLLCQDVVSCSALLSAYVEQGLGEKALWLYRQMLEEGLSSDKCADILALQACGIISQSEDLKGQELALEVGQPLHAKARTQGFEYDADFHSLLHVPSADLEEVEEQWTKPKVLSMGEALHCDAEMRSFTSDIFINNTILSIYVGSGIA
ncbi:hypothetical protein L7F22_030229 [Adiantum nelumboides]|nr:hypothetical protein [Adiantum nelumboides]